MRPLFLWARPEVVQTDRILQQKAPYLNVPFFTVRAVVYFAFWLLCMFLLTKWSAAQDRGEAAVTPADSVRFRTGQRARTAVPGADRQPRVGRLDHVARSALVFDDLRSAHGRRPGAVGAGIHDCGARAHRSDRERLPASCHAASLSRSGQADAGVRDAVGVPGLLAVPDHLVRQPAGRDPLVRRADSRGLGSRCRCCS